jgi:hypothetical protein
MQPTIRLPITHQYRYTLSAGKNRVAQLVLILAALSALVIAWQLIRWVFPALWRPVSSGIFLIDRYGLLVVVIGMVLLHENMHALVAWRFTHHWPAYGVTPLGIYINTAEWYFPRSVMISISIAPFLLLTLLGFLFLVTLPAVFTRLLVWFILLNGAGSINDVAVAAWVFFQPDSTLIQNDGLSIRIYRVEGKGEPSLSLRDRIREFLEKVWIKPDP